MPQNQLMMMKRFSPAGRIQANKMVADLEAQGSQAKIGETWMDYGAGIAWETVLVYSPKINMWYQALSSPDFDTLNAGGMPRGYKQILESARQ